MNRRRFFQRGAAGIVVYGSVGLSQTVEVQSRTYVYKKVGDLEISADAQRSPGDAVLPVAVWIHGGALINGGREGVPARLKELLIGAGFAVVSIDYRLAPETQLPAIIEDVEDAFAWIRRDGPDRLAVDPDRLAVLGGSAGGYLTLVTGYRVQPRPKALVSFWGYGDLIGEWYSTPSPHERHHQVVMTTEEALAQVSGPPIANATDRKGDGGAFYQYCRQHGVWPQEVSGWDPNEEAEKFFPYMPVKNVTPDYPPTLLVHGTADTDVPYEQSQMMTAELDRHGVEHELLTVEGAEHGLAGVPEDVKENVYASAMRFVKDHVATADPRSPR